MRLLYEPLTNVPTNFTEVEYLQSTGTQYIMSGLSMPNGFRIKGTISIDDLSVTGGIFGCYTNSSPYYRNFFDYTSGKNWLVGYGGGAYQYFGSNVVNTIYNFDVCNVHGKEHLEVNGTEYAFSPTGSTGNFTNLEMSIFALNISGTINNIAKIKLYRLEVYDENGVLVRDYLPCLDKNNNPCLFDRVGKKAYYNAGSGTFNVGRKIIPVEYIESSGTQYIDTGVSAKSGISSKLDFEYTALDTTSISMLDARSGNDRFYMCHSGYSNGYWFYYGYGSAFQSSKQPVVNTRYKIETSLKTGSQTMVVNGETILSGSSVTSYNLGINLYLFGINYGTPQFLAKARLYSTKIYDGDVLIRDYIPAKDENDVGYLFDKVTHTVYLNAGTGSFVVGKTLPKNKLRLIKDSKRRVPKGFKEVEYLEGTGTQYIDTGYVPTNTTGQFAVMRYTTVNNGVTFGGMISNNRVVGPYYAPNTSKWYCGWGSNEPSISASTPTTSTVYKLYLNFNNDRIAKVNDTILSNGLDNISGAYPTLTLFRRNYSAAYAYLSGKIYKYQITEGTKLVRDMIPCLDASNVPCMWDAVERKTYYNAGTGTFSYGNTITPVAYLQSSGTQYIDTGYTSNNIYTNSACEVICETSDLSNRVVGCGGLSDNNKNISLSFSGGGYVLGLYGDRWTSNIFAYSTNTKYKIKFEVSTSQQKLYVNDNLIETTTYSWNSSNNYPLRLFKTNADTYTKPTKIYGFKLWISDSLVKDLIPVKDENNVGYLFDRVNHILYSNAGSGSFVFGNEITKDITRFLEGE